MDGFNPYKGLPPTNFWRRSVSTLSKHEFDPVVEKRFVIGRKDKVVTAGSCFAQHMAKALVRAGFNYLVTERGEHLPEEERARQQYGVFSARYGNVYTVRQLADLMAEAFDGRIPHERAWKRSDGRFIDPYRPRISPDGFESEEELLHSRGVMLEAVREMIVKGDVFVFTLGLTEGWRSRIDGSAFPLAPGVAGGSYDPARHEFVNFSVTEVIRDLEETLLKIRGINHRIRVLLTVSPVPLIATHERRHVAVATTYSKSVLRVAAEEIYRKHPWVDYFPSYEIITANITRGDYYENDLREVTAIGVSHVMRIFLSHYTAREENAHEGDRFIPLARPTDDEIVCDEKTIDGAARC